MIEEPFGIYDNTFEYVIDESNQFTTATLYVPAGTMALYEANDGWKNFKEIIEIMPDIGSTFVAAVPNGNETADLIFKVTKSSPLEVTVWGVSGDISGAVTIPAAVSNESGASFSVTGIGVDGPDDNGNIPVMFDDGSLLYYTSYIIPLPSIVVKT